MAFITTGLSNAMPDFMQNKKSAKRSINTIMSTTRPVTTNKKSATDPFKKSTKQGTVPHPRSPDESSVLDINTLRHKASSDWSDSLDPGISCGGKKGKELMVAQWKLTDVSLVSFMISCIYGCVLNNI